MSAYPAMPERIDHTEAIPPIRLGVMVNAPLRLLKSHCEMTTGCDHALTVALASPPPSPEPNNSISTPTMLDETNAALVSMDTRCTADEMPLDSVNASARDQLSLALRDFRPDKVSDSSSTDRERNDPADSGVVRSIGGVISRDETQSPVLVGQFIRRPDS